MESQIGYTAEEQEAREKFRTGLVRLGKQVTEHQEGKGPDYSMIPPHLLGRQ